jgi:ADP-ribose pyrophosphatase YjhB (NUDIX family)
VVDLTADQFLPGETVTGGETRQRPVDGPGRCQGQYALLRHRVLSALAPSPARDTTPSRIAVAALTDPNGAVLLLPPDTNRGTEPGRWSLPSGHIAPGEPPAEAIARELTGLVVRDLRAVWTDQRPDHTELHAFTGTATEPGQTARFVPVTELPDLNLGPTTAAVLHRRESLKAVPTRSGEDQIGCYG